MITLTTGQEAFSDPTYKVFKGGDYEPTALVEVYTDDPTLATGMFQASFIATGEFQ